MDLILLIIITKVVRFIIAIVLLIQKCITICLIKLHAKKIIGLHLIAIFKLKFRVV
jgi:hypothetical protein